MAVFRLFSVFVICCALTIAGCSKSSTEAGLEKDDTDGDGIADIYDPDIDGDGIPENNNPNYCDSIQVYGLNDEQTTGSRIELTWKFFNSNVPNGECTLKDGVTAGLVAVHASAAGAKSTTSEKTNPLKTSRAEIQIPLACTGETVKVTYDFTEIATLIKADPNAPGWIVTQTHRADPQACDADGDGSPDFVEPVQCPPEATGTYPECICPAGEGYDVLGNRCLPLTAGVNLNCPIFATGTYPDCSCPGGQNYNEETKKCCTTNANNHEDCVTECRVEYLDCLRKCETEYCSEQCGKWFESCVEGDNGCNDCWPEEPPARSNPESFGVATVPDPDTDNDGIRNDSDSDVDGDGVPNTSDKDIDGDGIPNKDDLDIDGDGQINSIDPDADGDGTPDAEDDTPGGPR